jgi:hypothetical protein
MTSQVAIAPLSSGNVVVEQSGAAAGTDTVPAGCLLLLRNTGAGTHVVSLAIAAQAASDGLIPGNPIGFRPISMANGTVYLVRVPASYGDANGRVGIGVDGTPTEVKYNVIGA